MMVERSWRSRARQRTLCCCARLRRAVPAASEKVRIPASVVEEVEVIHVRPTIRPWEVGKSDMRMCPKRKE